MNDKQLEQLKKLRSILADLHDQWEKGGGGHCKMSEGYVGVTLNYPNWFDADSTKDKYIDAEPEITVEVYSYLFGPSRMHEFKSLEHALEAVSSWKFYPEEL